MTLCNHCSDTKRALYQWLQTILLKKSSLRAAFPRLSYISGWLLYRQADTPSRSSPTLKLPDVKFGEKTLKTLLCHFLYDGKLAAIRAASGAYSVIDVPCATVRANCHCWSYSLVMSSSLGCSCLTLSSFRMCHCFIYLIVIIL